jgi:ribosomal protein S18 acetylase RimI-like enzyme
MRELNIYEEVEQEYERLFPGSPFFRVWVPRERFISGHSDGAGNLSFTREDGGLFGIAIGPDPYISPEWNRFSVETIALEGRGVNGLPEPAELVDAWDCYWAPTVTGVSLNERKFSDSVIQEFLELHAPNSSVFPGDDEILHWIEVIEDGELVGVGALCRWQSGNVVISSVGTHIDRRRQGIGRQVMEGALSGGSHFGASFISLGVMHSNESAQRLYRALGFTLMHNFTYFERR